MIRTVSTDRWPISVKATMLVSVYQHARPKCQNGKDFWDRAIVLTSKDANLTKVDAVFEETMTPEVSDE